MIDLDVDRTCCIRDVSRLIIVGTSAGVSRSAVDGVVRCCRILTSQRSHSWDWGTKISCRSRPAARDMDTTNLNVSCIDRRASGTRRMQRSLVRNSLVGRSWRKYPGVYLGESSYND